MMNKNPFENFLQKHRPRINKLLEKHLSKTRVSKNLDAAMRYAVLNGGKRLRPLLVYAVGKNYGANLKSLDAPACALEIIHSFSLIHDDLPAMDNDDLRRGKPTCHKAFDEATAILAGDALAIFAFQIINESSFLTPQQIVEMNKTLATLSGANGMAGGQDIDVQATNNKLNKKELEHMYLLKTGSLLRASVKLGAIAANIDDQKELKNLDSFAKNIGLAFQIQDDILDIESNVAKLGKNIGSDKKQNKITCLTLAGMSAAKTKVKKLWGNAEKNLQELKMDSHLLQGFVDYIRQRDC